jgi:hypothetical protein
MWQMLADNGGKESIVQVLSDVEGELVLIARVLQQRLGQMDNPYRKMVEWV